MTPTTWKSMPDLTKESIQKELSEHVPSTLHYQRKSDVAPSKFCQHVFKNNDHELWELCSIEGKPSEHQTFILPVIPSVTWDMSSELRLFFTENQKHENAQEHKDAQEREDSMDDVARAWATINTSDHQHEQLLEQIAMKIHSMVKSVSRCVVFTS